MRIAVGSMANAIKRISVARGYDVTRYTLQCFGGAGGQHACQVADAFGIEHIFCHPLAGVLSALGMGLADQIAMREATLESVLDPAGVAAARRLAERLAREAGAALAAQGVPAERVRRKARLMVRYQGTDTALPCELPAHDDVAAIRAEFEAAYRRRFAFLMPSLDLVIEAVTVECVGVAERARDANLDAGRVASPACRESARASTCIAWRTIEPAGWRSGLLLDGEGLAAGISIEGPAIIAQRNATIVVEPGWRALVTAARQSRAPPSSCPGCGAGARHPGRSRHARSVQQFVHEHRGADGPLAAEHGSLGEHQGAPGFQLCGVRRRAAISSPTRRTCPCTSAR